MECTRTLKQQNRYIDNNDDKQKNQIRAYHLLIADKALQDQLS